MGAIGILIKGLIEPNSKIPFFFILGILFFSGSLWLLIITQIKKLGMITPIGGILLILGFFEIIYSKIK